MFLHLVHGDSVDVPMTCGFAFRHFLNSEKFDFDVFSHFVIDTFYH